MRCMQSIQDILTQCSLLQQPFMGVLGKPPEATAGLQVPRTQRFPDAMLRWYDLVNEEISRDGESAWSSRSSVITMSSKSSCTARRPQSQAVFFGDELDCELNLPTYD